MKFKDFKYTRPDVEKYKADINKELENFNNAATFEEADAALARINKIRNESDSLARICRIRHTINTSDEFYLNEDKFLNSNRPLYKELNTFFYKSLYESKFRTEFEKKYGSQLFNIAGSVLNTYNNLIDEDLVKESDLATEYRRLTSSGVIEFDGKKVSLSEMNFYTTSSDRDVRKRSNEAKWKFFEANSKRLDEIYDELVKLRHTMAIKLGFKDFVELSYANMGRTDYNRDDVKKFRDNVKEFIVPVVAKMKEKQRKRLGVDKMYYYDESVFYTSGNPRPKDDLETILQNSVKVYDELSPETGEFFRFMYNNEMLDLPVKKDKAIGGYCTFISSHKSPFIFSNFNGTEDDIKVLTHEAGHAFQAYSSQNFSIPEYTTPTMEACEIHSMSMEFLTWDWMNLYFGENADKFKYAHLSKAIEFIPYGVTVDEFQHFVFENPEATPKERNQKWLELEKKYLPWKKYENNPFLESGGFWQHQRHIYEKPFYYIDYCLAEICALQFWNKYNNSQNGNRKEVLKDYITLCKAGGSMSFLDLVKLAKLEYPFGKEAMESSISNAAEWLDKTDDSKF
ncbi:M3 family oligoendopeptidase [soil metagenome]